MTKEKHEKIYELTNIEPQKEDVEKLTSSRRYSETELFNMLPNKLILGSGKLSDTYKLTINHECIEYKATHTLEQFSYKRFFILDSTLHEALLDAVLWCIANNHIKKEQQEQ